MSKASLLTHPPARPPQAYATDPSARERVDHIVALWDRLRASLVEEEQYGECIEVCDIGDAELEEAAKDAAECAATALTELRAAVRRELLQDTRVFVCTIDATARMVNELKENEVGCEGVGVDTGVGLASLEPGSWE